MGLPVSRFQEVEPQLALVYLLNNHRQPRSKLLRRTASTRRPVIGGDPCSRPDKLPPGDGREVVVADGHRQIHDVKGKLPGPILELLSIHAPRLSKAPATPNQAQIG